MSSVYPIRCHFRADGGGTTRVDVYDDIGEGGWFAEGLTAKSFAAQMSSVRGPLEVHVNSGGGDVFDGIAIMNAIRAHKGPVTMIVDGIAASIASVIAQAGQERVMAPGAMMMIHDAFGMTVGNAAEMAKMAETLDQVSGNIAAIYAERCGGTADTWRDSMKAESWYTADEAVAAGLADRVGEDAAQLPPGMDLAAFTAVPGRIAARMRTMPVAQAPRAAADAAAVCKTCDGRKRLKHPGTGNLGQKCPGCDGTGTYDPDAGAGNDDGEDTPGQDLVLQDLRAAVFAALADASDGVDRSPWDGPKAMSGGTDADDPAAFYAGICAGAKAGDKSTQAAWALPYKYTPSSPPNAAGVKAALGRLPQTEGLTNAAEAKKTLQAAMKKVDPDYEPDDSSHLDLSGVDLGKLGNALKEAVK